MIVTRVGLLEDEPEYYVLEILSDNSEVLQILKVIAKYLRKKGIDVVHLVEYGTDLLGIQIKVERKEGEE